MFMLLPPLGSIQIKHDHEGYDKTIFPMWSWATLCLMKIVGHGLKITKGNSFTTSQIRIMLFCSKHLIHTIIWLVQLWTRQEQREKCKIKTTIVRISLVHIPMHWTCISKMLHINVNCSVLVHLEGYYLPGNSMLWETVEITHIMWPLLNQ